MYSILLFLHNAGRWLVLIALTTSIVIAALAVATSPGKNTTLRRQHPFTATAHRWRHWTATIAQLQLLLGMLLYFQSPVVKNAVPGDPYHLVNEHTFFRYIHISLMFLGVIVITIGSAKSKRAENDMAKYRTLLTWFTAGLLILLIAIPWPFSPFAGRPLLRHY